MKPLSLRVANKTITLLLLMIACVFPICAQDVATPQTSAAQTTPETIREATNSEVSSSEMSGQTNTDSLAEVKSSPPVDSNQTSAKQTAAKPFVFPTRRERFNRYLKSTVGPFALARSAVSAGIDQWRDHPEEWQQGASGYGKRFASGFGQNAIQQTVTYGIDSAFGLDTGFQRSKRKGFFPRMTDALVENLVSRTRSGKRVISVPRFAGAYSSGLISHAAWYPERYSYKDGLRSGTRSMVAGFALNLVREFVIEF
jgi:hypothetical protein